MTKHKSMGLFAVAAISLSFTQTAQCMSAVAIEGREASLLPQGKKFKLVWNDEFDGDRLDESKWALWGRTPRKACKTGLSLFSVRRRALNPRGMEPAGRDPESRLFSVGL